MNFFTRLGRSLLLVAAVVMVGLMGCGGDSWTNSGGGGDNGNNVIGGTNCTSAETCKKVTIDGVTWMAENLNVKTTDSWCYGNSKDNCAKYGGLYTWEAAKSACQLIGWRLPDSADWERLVEAVGGAGSAGSKLKSITGWTAYSGVENLDTYGFSALPGGLRSGNDSNFSDIGDRGLWWTATRITTETGESTNKSWAMGMRYEDNNVEDYGLRDIHSGSVRCVR
jgi:uncharacterized protein (TIGR02145 family)